MAPPWSSPTTAIAATAPASPSRPSPMCPRTSESLPELVAPLIGRPVAEPQPLDGGITNRNFRVRTAEGDFVVRVYGEKTAALGIDRPAERLATEPAARPRVG